MITDIPIIIPTISSIKATLAVDAVSNDDFIYSVKCILDCLPVSVSTETVYSYDQ